MKSSAAAFAVLLCAPLAYGDAYTSLLHRYEKQIQQQEQQLGSLRGRLQEKERDVVRWKNKAGEAKAAWTEASATLEQTRAKVKIVHDKRMQVSVQADAAQWKTTESVLISRSAAMQARLLAQDLYTKTLIGSTGSADPAQDRATELILPKISELSASSQQLAEVSQKEETALRTDEMRWQTEEQARSDEADRLHQKQEGQWLKWQEALRRKTALEDEISEIDQSAKALQVMLQELRNHRDQARALRENRSTNDDALASLKGTLPWPAHGRVVQNFGRQYPDGLNQLVVSNGIKIDAGQNHTVRTIQEGKVLFANAFRQYGQLVIVQHKGGLTSVYAGLGQTQVKEGQLLTALDQIGLTGEKGSFYFELRRDEQPINPLVYLTPATTTQLSLRRDFR
jgi:septal ring factor EnvC (AmiA/AmiB activator)